MPPAGVNLLSAPLDVHGDWGGSLPGAAAAVISRMREACLSGLRLLSDHQPDHLRVDDEASGPPHVWLHEENPTTAWIVVDIGTRAWSQLAYQFGHELGHVMCNSWMWKVETPPPSRWLEECLAEAFSMRGLGRLADAWEQNPPFAGDAGYGRRASRLSPRPDRKIPKARAGRSRSKTSPLGFAPIARCLTARRAWVISQVRRFLRC